jgi:hypothetical protein
VPRTEEEEEGGGGGRKNVRKERVRINYFHYYFHTCVSQQIIAS